jgi:hypothetical protein
MSSKRRTMISGKKRVGVVGLATRRRHLRSHLAQGRRRSNPLDADLTVDKVPVDVARNSDRNDMK